MRHKITKLIKVYKKSNKKPRKKGYQCFSAVIQFYQYSMFFNDKAKKVKDIFY